MAERQVALVPTMIQLDNFEPFAARGEAKFPTYAEHMRSLYADTGSTCSAPPTTRACRSMPAPTPGGYQPHGLVGTRDGAARPSSARAEYALGAGSWRARDWLGLSPTPGRRGPGRSGGLRRRPPARSRRAAATRGTSSCADAPRLPERRWLAPAPVSRLGRSRCLLALDPGLLAVRRGRDGRRPVTETALMLPGTPEPDGNAGRARRVPVHHRPAQPRPAIVLAHGFGGTKADSAGTARRRWPATATR